jgi:hypothetical protein
MPEFRVEVILLHIRGLAGLAANAAADIDQLRHFVMFDADCLM